MSVELIVDKILDAKKCIGEAINLLGDFADELEAKVKKAQSCCPEAIKKLKKVETEEIEELALYMGEIIELIHLKYFDEGKALISAKLNLALMQRDILLTR